MPLTLKLFRKKDPVITDDELSFMSLLLSEHIDWAKQQMERGKVSEAVIRHRHYAESALEKIDQARQSKR